MYACVSLCEASVCIVCVSTGIVINLSADAITDDSESAKDIMTCILSPSYVGVPGNEKPILM